MTEMIEDGDAGSNESAENTEAANARNPRELNPPTPPPAAEKHGWLGGSNGVRAGLVVVVLIAAAARFIGLGGLEPWEDEIYSFIGSSDLIQKQLMWTGERMTLHSPLPYVEIKLVRAVLGRSEFALRLPAALYGTLAVGAFYVLMARMFDPRAAFFSAALLAVHPFALEWAREARMYSHWLATTAIMVALAHAAVSYARRDAEASVLNWRWWLLGVVFNWAHCSALFAVTTIAAVGLWLGVIGLLALFRQPRTGGVILGGAALASFVYATGWSLSGIGRLLGRMTQSGAGHGGEAAAPHASLFEALPGVIRGLGGHVPLGVGIAFVVLSLIGLGILLYRKHFEASALLLMVGFTPWLAYSSIAGQHFFTPRYVIVDLLPLCAGLGVLVATLLTLPSKGKRAIGIAVCVAGAVALSVAWSQPWRELYTVPKARFREAMAPVMANAHEHDVWIPIPEWYVQIDRYYPVSQKVKPIIGPMESRVFTGRDGDPQAIRKMGFEGDFETLFNRSSAERKALPPAAWVLIVNPSAQRGEVNGHVHTRLDEIRPLLEAYGLDVAKQLETLHQAAKTAMTLTFWVYTDGVSHVTTTRGRSRRMLD